MGKLTNTLRRAATRAGLPRAALRLRRGRPVILMYHGVTATRSFDGLRNASDLHLARETFVSHLRLLRRHRRVIGISEMAEGLRDGADLRNTVALTFDDGYLNNVLEAAPLLADHQLPAAFFLATSYIGTDRWMWTDLLEHALGTTRAGHLVWNDLRWPLSSMEDRRATLQSIKAQMKGLSVADRDRTLTEITEALGVRAQRPADDYRFMNWQQARQLVDAGFEVGAHSVNHAILSRVSPSDAEAEIRESRDAVVAATGRCCPVFCYPNGKAADYNDDVITACRRHFVAALSTKRGPAQRDDLFELARLSTHGSANDLALVLLRER